MKKDYLKTMVFFMALMISVNAYSMAYQEVWFFDMVNGNICTPEGLAAGYVTGGEVVPPGCVVTSETCTNDLMGTSVIDCGLNVPGEYEGAVVGGTTIPDMSLNGLKDAENAAYDAWYASTGVATCEPGTSPAGVSTGYVVYEGTGVSPGTGNANLGFYKRVHCVANGASSTGLQPIDTLFVGGGGGGGSVDLTTTNTAIGETNRLIGEGNAESVKQTTALQGIKTAIEQQGPNTAGGTGGTVNVDMTATNDLLTSINSKMDGVYTGAGPVTGAVDTSLRESNFLNNAKNEFTGFQTSVKGTALYNSIGTFFNGLPAGGASVFSVHTGRLGNHSIDLADYSTVWNIIKALILIMCSYVSIKIIFLGRA